MLGFRLALSLLRIPRLFVSLLLFPLFLSLVIVVIQLFATQVAIQFTVQSHEQMEKRIEYDADNNLVRQFIYGSGKKLPPILVCRWEKIIDEQGITREFPSSKECSPDVLDVAIHVDNPKTFPVDSYVDIFSGNFHRLHICEKQCRPHVIVTPGERGRTDTYSIPALMLIGLSHVDDSVNLNSLQLAKTRQGILEKIGTQFHHAEGYEDPIQLTETTYELALLISVASIVIIGLWLAVKAHRKVLDYFARSGALLPMVAGMGKKEFYTAIWFVTALRVGAFLLASVPSTYFLFSNLGTDSDWGGLFEKDSGHFILWLLTLIVSFSFAALVASVADLKHRYSIFAFGYRYLPLLLSLAGMILWAGTFLLTSGTGLARDVLISLPIIGMGPVILAPIFQPSLNLLVLNCLLTTGLMILLIRSNSRWFAAHLEDL